MKHWFLFILVISWFCFPLSGQQSNRPDWVKQHGDCRQFFVEYVGGRW